MTKERLKELIKQGATIYYTYENGCVKTIDLSYGISKFKIGKNYVERKIIGTGFTERYIINKLFENKEQAEWVLKTYAERTERFEPPMWEEIENHYEFNFISNGTHYYLAVYKHKDCNEIDVGEICGNTLFVRLATKENYEKACEIVKELFLKGGAKND
ncbi:MAG: hypothetical protein KIG16_01815 [Eubacteriales bacterium]|nr:hypothetical protein [Eubacteriales bacterium]